MPPSDFLARPVRSPEVNGTGSRKPMTAADILRPPPMGKKDESFGCRIDAETSNMMARLIGLTKPITGRVKDRSDLVRAALHWWLPEALAHAEIRDLPEAQALYADWLQIKHEMERAEEMARIERSEREYKAVLESAAWLVNQGKNPTGAARVLDGWFRTIEAYAMHKDELAGNMERRVRADYTYKNLVGQLQEEFGLPVRWPETCRESETNEGTT
jgi:Arc/MetJ-type ribon-helix-helix transcriptional regulator